MIIVKYPEPDFRLKKEDGKEFIFDTIRKQWIRLTEEEWVRQNFIAYLVRVLQYPASMIAIEKEITLGDLKKRFDILVYNRSHQPWMLVECKRQDVPAGDTVLEQALRYHISIPAAVIVITDGDVTFGWRKINGQLVGIDGLPAWGST